MVELDSSTLYETSPTPLTALLEKLQNVYHNVRHELLAKIYLCKNKNHIQKRYFQK